MEGIIIAISCGIYSVLVDKVVYQTSPRGLFRKNKIKPVVGDHVLLDTENFLITDVLPRTSLLKRPPIANVNQILLVFSLSEPSYSHYLTLKYLCYANYLGVPSRVILTKTDKLDEEKEALEIKKTLESVGVETYLVSNKTKEGVEEVKALINGKISCLIGQTGAGKSSLLNNIDPAFNREIGEYSKALGRGKHQTKEVVLLPILDGYIADTPGFSSLELDIPYTEISHYFPGMKEAYLNCFYSNCMHISEKKCAVKEKFSNENIPSIIYDSYLKLIEELKENYHG